MVLVKHLLFHPCLSYELLAGDRTWSKMECGLCKPLPSQLTHQCEKCLFGAFSSWLSGLLSLGKERGGD